MYAEKERICTTKIFDLIADTVLVTPEAVKQWYVITKCSKKIKCHATCVANCVTPHKKLRSKVKKGTKKH